MVLIGLKTLIVATEDSTEVSGKWQSPQSTINAGEYYIIEGNCLLTTICMSVLTKMFLLIRDWSEPLVRPIRVCSSFLL
ncbi:MAG: hypothetical protein CM15mP92_0180 [Halieaceae bacterium]|nr:MAG: hypothetical protein CM15mP92_0180 [Halieaceae bacterium]